MDKMAMYKGGTIDGLVLLDFSGSREHEVRRFWEQFQDLAREMGITIGDHFAGRAPIMPTGRPHGHGQS